MSPEYFRCANTNCAYAIASEGLNVVQLEVLRRWAKTCEKCGNRAKFIEQQALLNTQTKQTDGGSKHAESKKRPKKDDGTSPRQKRRDKAGSPGLQ